MRSDRRSDHPIESRINYCRFSIVFVRFCVEISQPKRLHPNSKIYCPTICSRTLAICLLPIVNRCRHRGTHKSPNNTVRPPTRAATPTTAKWTIRWCSPLCRHQYNGSIRMPAAVHPAASSPISIQKVSVKI